MVAEVMVMQNRQTTPLCLSASGGFACPQDSTSESNPLCGSCICLYEDFAVMGVLVKLYIVIHEPKILTLVVRLYLKLFGVSRYIGNIVSYIHRLDIILLTRLITMLCLWYTEQN